MAPKIPAKGDRDEWLSYWLTKWQEAQDAINADTARRVRILEERQARLYAIVWILGPIASMIFGSIAAIITGYLIKNF